MPIRLDNERQFLPTLVVKPDMRFANTFLDTKYRDYSVPGEALMDKISGELFLKRPKDGRVISFFQNKKMIHDITLELRVMMVNNENFIYPENDENAFFVSTNYDLLTINNEIPINLLENSTITISNSNTDSINTLNFNISSYANGFFCRFSTRDCDKPVVEFLTNKYNTFFKNYDGTNHEFLQEKEKFNTIELWEDSNCVITYTATKYSDNNVVGTLRSITCPIRLNENSCVLLPSHFVTARENVNDRDYDYIKIEIESFELSKIDYLMSHTNAFDDDFITEYNKLIFEENAIRPAELNIMRFIDKVDHINLLGNEILMALLDIPYINRYMAKMAKLKEASQFLTTIYEPSVIDWDANTCWAERIRDVYKGGKSDDTDAVDPFDDIEDYFTQQHDPISGFIVTDPNSVDNFLLIDIDEVNP